MIRIQLVMIQDSKATSNKVSPYFLSVMLLKAVRIVPRVESKIVSYSVFITALKTKNIERFYVAIIPGGKGRST